MGEQLTPAAKTLARWCYRRGVDERVLGCGEQLLKAAVDQALGRAARAHLEHSLWQQVATLLRQRRDWDRDHQVTPRRPPRVCPAPWRSRGAPTTPAGAVVPAVASCTASSSTRASTPTRAAAARAGPVPTRHQAHGTDARHAADPISLSSQGHATFQSSQAAVIARALGPHIGDRRTGAAGAGRGDPWEFT
jgi:hypothetical protein